MTTNIEKTSSFEESGVTGLVADWSSDKQAFDMPWGKLMMWIFLLSDTFIFSLFLTSYMKVRMSVTEQWPPVSEIFATNCLCGLALARSGRFHACSVIPSPMGGQSPEYPPGRGKSKLHALLLVRT